MNGDGPIPDEHYIGRLSEEFGGALPTQIMAEIAVLPVGYLERVLEYRRYRDAKLEFDAADSKERRMRLRATSMGALAEQIGMELQAEESGIDIHG